MLKAKLLSNKILILILLLSFCVSLAYAFIFSIEPASDAGAYDTIAVNIAGGFGYQEDLSKDIANDFAIARVGPLYPYFLAGVYKVFGHHFEAVWILQAILHALSVLLIYLTALAIFSNFEQKKIISLWAAGIFGFYPDLIEISAMIMAETLYLFFVCLAVYVFFKFFNRTGTWPVILLGLTFGLATLSRPPVLFLIPVLLFYFYRQKKLLATVLFIVVLVMIFTPWTLRNYSIYERFMPFGAAGAMNFWTGNFHGGNGEQMAHPAYLDFLNSHKITETADESVRQFKFFLKNYPGEFLKISVLRINKYFSIIRPIGFWFYQSGWSQFIFLCSSSIASIILFVFGIGGLIKSIKLKNKVLYYLMAFTLITPAIFFIAAVETRYRFQIYPLLAIFAGYFIVYLFKERKFWTSKILWLSITIIFLNGFVDLLFSLEKFKERLGWFL